MLDSFPTVRLELQSRPECVTLVRSMLAGLSEFLELEPELLDDLRTAVSEACNNVVLHAYRGEEGPLSVSLEVNSDGFEVVVRDRGGGIQRVAAVDDRMGVGLAVISALADRAEFETHPDGGTAVRMSFSRAGVAVLDADAQPVLVPDPELGGEVVGLVAPVALGTEVLGRLTRAVAAGAHFSVDRFSDLYPVTDAISQFAESHAVGQSLTFAIDWRSRRIQLVVGPFATGSAEALRGQKSGSPLARLVNDVTARSSGDYELLEMTIADRRDGN